METVTSIFNHEFIATNRTAPTGEPPHDSQPMQAGTMIHVLETAYVKAQSLKMLVEYFERDYVNKVARVSYEDGESEKWFIFSEGSWVEIDPEQLWFWTKAWQAGELEVDEYLSQGDVEEFDDINSFVDSL